MKIASPRHYDGFAHNLPALSLCVDVDCYEGYMVLVCAIDEEHPKPNLVGESFVFPQIFPN